LFAIKAHALKGMLAMLGARDLSEIGKKLEFAAKEERYDECAETLDLFIEAMTQFHSYLKSVISESGYNNTEAANTADGNCSQEDILKLAQYCEMGQGVEIDRLNKQLKGARRGSALGDIMNEAFDFIDAFDYDQAAELLRKAAQLIEEA
jgi:HPt (histidine-containing phosphotransfer) domain-containing protein